MKRAFVFLTAFILAFIAFDGLAISKFAKADVVQNDRDEFEDIIVIDDKQCQIVITGIEPDNIFGYTLKAHFENKSTDKTYMFSVVDAAINGVQTDPFFATEVSAEKEANSDISFFDQELLTNGIGDFTDIELVFRVYDSNDWSADDVANVTVHIYPLGEEKAAVFSREGQPTDITIVDNDNVSVIVTGYSIDDIWSYTMHLYLVNKTNMNLTFSADEVSVNGIMADPFWASTIGAGRVSFEAMSWFDSTFEENGITDVEEIEMKLRIYNSDDWSADDIYSETIVLNP